MILRSPFHERTSVLNETGLWSHWSGTLATRRYQMSDKFEYFAVRNSAGIFDSSPLYKYRIHGPDAERFLSGVLVRDIRACSPGHAQYTAWCDDRGFVVEDGVVLRHGRDEFLLTAAEPNLAYFSDLIGRDDVRIEEVSQEHAVLAVQGPRSRDLVARLVPDAAALQYFGLATGKIAGSPVTVSRTGYSGDLGFEIWIKSADALTVWDTLWESVRGHGVLPFGLDALEMLRIEAGLLMLDVDFSSSRFGWTDEDRSTPFELGLGWMIRDLASDDRAFIGRRALEREMADGTSRWRMTGLVLDWQDYDRIYTGAGLIPPKDHTPVLEELFVYDENIRQVGYATSFMYSPMLQRHIAMARVRPDLARAGSSMRLEVDVNHRYEYVKATTARLPLYSPARKTA
ncbi:MAG: aminomethyltransferase [Chloroflexota bacterium]|jgi:aminomethyltransferase|nr:aminomethyltransferase [Chloroflexota bacterium]